MIYLFLMKTFLRSYSALYRNSSESYICTSSLKINSHSPQIPKTPGGPIRASKQPTNFEPLSMCGSKGGGLISLKMTTVPSQHSMLGHHRHGSMRARLILMVFGSSHQLRKKGRQSWTPSDKNFLGPRMLPACSETPQTGLFTPRPIYTLRT